MRSMMVRIPCGPVRISLKKLRIETQIIGEMSTPDTGGTICRVTLRTGSVGAATLPNRIRTGSLSYVFILLAHLEPLFFIHDPRELVEVVFGEPREHGAHEKRERADRE